VFERENEEEAYSFMKNNDRSFCVVGAKARLAKINNNNINTDSSDTSA
jgi:hypothetical protein